MKQLDVPLYFVFFNLYTVTDVLVGDWDDLLECYEAGDEFTCTHLGLDETHVGHGTFSSTNRSEVIAFQQGYRAMRKMLAPAAKV